MERHEDPNDSGNAAKHHTGKQCIESGCTRPAGTAWSPLWCQPCNSDRLRHLTDVLVRLGSRHKQPYDFLGECDGDKEH